MNQIVIPLDDYHLILKNYDANEGYITDFGWFPGREPDSDWLGYITFDTEENMNFCKMKYLT